MQPCLAIVRKKTPVNPSPLTNRFTHVHLNHNLTYETMRQHQARKTVPYQDAGDAGRPVLLNIASRYWDLRKEASLHGAQLQWTTAQENNLCAEPCLPWVSGRDLMEREKRQAGSSGTILGKPVGVALPARIVRPVAKQKDRSAIEPTLHLINPEALKVAHSLSASEREGFASFGGGGGSDDSNNAVQQVFGILRAARAKVGGAIGVIAFGALAIMAIFALLYWGSKSIGLYVSNSTFGPLDYFWFSIRSFVTMSSPDMGPVNSFGRMLANAEGLLGLVTVIVLSLFIGEKMRHLLGED